jgi:predicted ribosomally synthesized peptide with nif11-like leader|tara:strand:+ start:671 stop:895 length:225 start_codon:yes stop_codon:yes gene_type:complete
VSREALKDFLHAVERSPRLRQAVQSCGTDDALIELATSNGFQVRKLDLLHDAEDTRISDWFDRSAVKRHFHIPS